LQQRRYRCVCKRQFTTQETFAPLITKSIEAKKRSMGYRPETTFAGENPFGTARIIPMPVTRLLTEGRVYQRGKLSPNAVIVLDHINTHSGVKLKELQAALKIKCVHRYVSCLHEDQLIDVSVHPSKVGRAFKRCWIKGELNGK
jgi:hypothetical protein